jgi:imidazole glycerol-phosphate synthase subunit HisH
VGVVAVRRAARRCFLTAPGVTLVHYGLGNIKAFSHIYHRLNIPVIVATTASQLRSARRIILPGVGAFDWAMTRLNESGLRETLDDLVLRHEVPVLGVCVGMQMMAQRSDEGRLPGLGWLVADVVSVNSCQAPSVPLPHMGWNDVRPTATDGLFHGIADPRYYFLHSYCVVAREPTEVLATANYGGDFTAALRMRNIVGTQFHPEKSHHSGVELLRNFAVS